MVPARGARSIAMVSASRLEALETGRCESLNHIEEMAMDQSRLLCNVFPALRAEAPRMRGGGFISRLRTGGEILFAAFGDGAAAIAQNEKSDTVRGWGAFGIEHIAGDDTERGIRMALPFAIDDHFAVREWAWLGVRNLAVSDIAAVLESLTAAYRSTAPRLRRFASELTRPRSVWGAHVPLLKHSPELAEEMLRVLADDSDRYVQVSVGNWLNDAARHNPEWVTTLCDSLAQRGAIKQTVLTRALRSLPL